MGCILEQKSDCSITEWPVHAVTLSDFKLGKYEVSQAQWNEIMETSTSNTSTCEMCPATNKSWREVMAFIQTLNDKTGNKFRLPTEAEWEYAARGGIKSKGFNYSGSNTLGMVGWYAENSIGKISPVGQKQGNELGLHDMSGNAAEWCQDVYVHDAYKIEFIMKTSSPPAEGPFRVVRGGSYFSPKSFCRVTNRGAGYPDSKSQDVGFRLASD